MNALTLNIMFSIDMTGEGLKLNIERKGDIDEERRIEKVDSRR